MKFGESQGELIDRKSCIDIMLTKSSNDRWEDFEYTYLRPENRFAYWGNGWTNKEKDLEYNIVPYLRGQG